MNLFDLKGLVVTAHPEALLVPEFKAIWDSDDSEDKSKALRELSFVYFMSDYKSPYVLSLTPDRLKPVVSKDFMKDEDYSPSSLVLEAIAKYKQLQKTPSMGLLEASIKTIHNLTNYLENVDLEERDSRDKPIYKPSDVTNSLKSIGGIVESLNKVRSLVEKEITQSGTLRGQRRKGNREDPS